MQLNSGILRKPTHQFTDFAEIGMFNGQVGVIWTLLKQISRMHWINFRFKFNIEMKKRVILALFIKFTVFIESVGISFEKNRNPIWIRKRGEKRKRGKTNEKLKTAGFCRVLTNTVFSSDALFLPSSWVLAVFFYYIVYFANKNRGKL